MTRSHAMATFIEIVRHFAGTLRTTFASFVPAQAEEQLKPAVKELLEVAGRVLGFQVEALLESRVAGLGGRPDIGVGVRRLLTGHVELKAPGMGARTDRFTGRDKEQWKKFQSLPNLIYTDGTEWVLYRSGELRGRVVRLGADLTSEGAGGVEDQDAAKLADLLRDFFLWEPIVPDSPQKLAEELAPLCHLLREEVIEALRQQSSTIAQLADEWRKTLFPARAKRG